MGTGGHQVLDKGFEAGEALTQFTFVKLATGEDRRVEACDTQGELAIGVVQEEVSAEDVTRGPRIVNVRLLGVSVVEAGDTITKMDEVTPGADGKAEPAATGDRVVGIALDDGEDGDWIAVLLTPAGPTVA